MLQFELGTGFPGVLLASARRRLWDFETGDYGPFASFARSGAGTAFTVDGHIQAYASGVPRITDKGLLLEGAAINYILRSTELESAAWTKANVAVTPNDRLAPDGSLTADLVVPDTVNINYKTVMQRPVGAPNEVILSLCARPAGYNYLAITITNSVGRCVINLLTGAINYYGVANLSLIAFLPLADGWVYAAVAIVNIGSATAYIGPRQTLADPAGSWVGDGVSGTHLWHVDIQDGTTLGSPIITAGAAAARGADSATLTVPAGCTTWEATYGDARTVVGGSGLTPGGTFDIVSGRPWVGLGTELKSVRFAP